jgi:hypothetical protein
MWMSEDRSNIAVGERTMPDLAYNPLASDAAALTLVDCHLGNDSEPI